MIAFSEDGGIHLPPCFLRAAYRHRGHKFPGADPKVSSDSAAKVAPDRVVGTRKNGRKSLIFIGNARCQP